MLQRHAGKISVDACVLESFDFQFDMRDPNSAPVSEVARSALCGHPYGLFLLF